MQSTTSPSRGFSHSGAVDEAACLIASDKVNGTGVYNRDGDRLGALRNFLVDKRSGQVAYLVMSMRGPAGMGPGYYPLPWRALTYAPQMGGYVVEILEDQLRKGPSYTSAESPRWDKDYRWEIASHYGTFI